MVCSTARYSFEDHLAFSLLEKREMMVVADESSPPVVNSYAFFPSTVSYP
jgi:hypothetical protein